MSLGRRERPHRPGDPLIAARRDRPLFLWVHYLDVHLPYQHTTDPTVSAATRKVTTGDFHTEVERLRGRPGLRDELWAAMMDEVDFVDGKAARLLAALPATAVVAFTADHGEELFEHDGFEHGHTLYQELLHVPLVIAGLDRAPGTEAAPVTLTDVTVTLLAAAGPRDPAMEGVDLAGPVDPDRIRRAGNLLRLAPDALRAARQGPWKLITPEGAPPLLYDLSVDPGETRDVAAAHPSVVQTLMTGPAAPTRGTAVEVGAEERARLEALGYLDPGP